jgi:glycosyltransferase involved in cell wall biosynthesis
MRKRIAIIGHFGGNEEFLDGQTVKTKILFDELSKNTDWDIQKIDTYLKNRKPFKLLMKTLLALLFRKDIIVLLSGNGMKFFFPILSFFAGFWKVRVFHDVIGGNLDKYIKKYPKFKNYLNSFAINWVETEKLRKNLLKCGVENCEVIPNFKRLSILDEKEIPKEFVEPFRFCTFSRVMKEKGVEDAIESIEKVNEEYGRNACALDIYGPVDDAYKSRFEDIMRKASDVVKYCGLVPFDKSVNILKGYFALLFPTSWMGEGFPGTIVDAYSAGLPVIASDWSSNSELVKDGFNGFMFPSKDCSDLAEAIKHLISLEKQNILKIKNNCLKAAKSYQPDEYIKEIISSMLTEGGKVL